MTLETQIQESLFAFARRAPFDADLSTYVTTYSKNPRLDQSEYTVNLLYGAGEHFGLFSDARYAFVLNRKWYPIAISSFDVEADVMLVKQIQGVKGTQEELKKLGRWDRMLLRITADCASRHGFRQVRSQRAEDNRYYGNTPETQIRNKLRYNVTAEREGFRFDEKLNCYVADLATNISRADPQ